MAWIGKHRSWFYLLQEKVPLFRCKSQENIYSHLTGTIWNQKTSDEIKILASAHMIMAWYHLKTVGDNKLREIFPTTCLELEIKDMQLHLNNRLPSYQTSGKVVRFLHFWVLARRHFKIMPARVLVSKGVIFQTVPKSYDCVVLKQQETMRAFKFAFW